MKGVFRYNTGMEASQWIGQHWFDLVQSVGIIASLLFSAYTTRKDERARRIGNLIAVNDEYRHIWREFYGQPGLSRVLKHDVDLGREPISDEE